MRLRNLIPFAFLLVLMTIYGCSGGDAVAPGTIVTPADSGRDVTLTPGYSGGQNLGTFQFVLNETAGTAECIQVDREGQKNVTSWATVIIEGYHFDPAERNWYIEARITNNTKYTGWGALVVFTQLGMKNIVGQDGYLFIPGEGGDLKRCPVIAYSKFSPERIFPPQHTDVRTVIIHVPPDAPGINPVEFFIDAWWPGARHEPYVEDLELMPFPPPGNYHIAANVHDWQTPESSALEVKGIIPMGEGNEPFVFPMFDDGMHNDGAPNDSHWGADFMFPAPPGMYQLIVKAWDPDDNQFENDLFFKHMGSEPCEPIPHWVIMEGPDGGYESPHEWTFYQEEPFAEFWANMVGPDIPPPPIFWQYHQVFAISLGERPTTGYWIRIDNVCIDNEEDVIHIDYTEMIPGEGCKTEDVITTPYTIYGMMRFADVPVKFTRHEEVYNCPECQPLPHEIIEKGDFSNRHDPLTKMIWDFPTWKEFYHGHNPNGDIPPINFDKDAVAVIMLGDRPTGGFWVRLDDVCTDENGVHIRYTEMIPGPDCDVPQIVTQPYMFISMPALEMPFHFEGKEEVYPCNNQDCLKFWPLMNGVESNYHEPQLRIFNNPESWGEFWMGHHPDEPVPQINFEEQTIVAVVAGDKPTTGFFVHIDWICPPEDPNQDGWVIQFTLEIPAENCPVEDIVTQPFDFVKAQKFEGPVQWVDKHHIYDCPPCLWIEPMVDGSHSGWHEKNLKVMHDVLAWHQFWNIHAPGEPAPIVDWDNEMVVALAMGDYPTTGFWVHLNDICQNPDNGAWVVNYTLEIPGDSCDEDQVVTQPFAYYFVQRMEGDFIFHGHEHVYECD